VLKQNQSCIL